MSSATIDELPAMLTLARIAKHLDCSLESVRRARRERLRGFPKGIRLRGIVRISRREYLHWLDSLREDG